MTQSQPLYWVAYHYRYNSRPEKWWARMFYTREKAIEFANSLLDCPDYRVKYVIPDYWVTTAKLR